MRIVKNSAKFSKDRAYRYTLSRVWHSNKAHVLFIGLNPSTADETINDRTITRCINFAKYWGYGGMCMVNLFAYVATAPEGMLRRSNPVGIHNDKYIKEAARTAGLIIAMWGTKGTHLLRDNRVLDLLLEYDIYCFGETKQGMPKHPLYLKATTTPVIYNLGINYDRTHDDD